MNLTYFSIIGLQVSPLRCNSCLQRSSSGRLGPEWRSSWSNDQFHHDDQRAGRFQAPQKSTHEKGEAHEHQTN